MWRLRDDEIHVWLVRLPASAPPPALAATLSHAEADAAARFRHAPSRHTYVAARGVLRQLLARYLDAPPEELRIAIGEKGKPAVSGPVRFNLSHSGAFALFGFARDCEVGVDVEAIRPSDDWLAIARRFFSAGEVAALTRLAATEREAAFFRCWTRKEAFVKALGEGLSVPLDSFAVSLGVGATRFEHLPREAGTWSLYDIPADAGHAAALAHPGGPRTLRLRMIDDPLTLCTPP